MVALLSFLETLSKIVGTVVLIGGPLVGGYRFFKKREYAVRLEPSIEGEVVTSGAEVYVRITTRVKNIGNSVAKLDPQRSYVDVCYFEAGQTVPVVVPTTWVKIYVLPKVNQLESMENEEYMELVKVPHADYLAFHLNFSVTTEPSVSKEKGRDWSRTTIVYCKLKPYDTNSP